MNASPTDAEKVNDVHDALGSKHRRQVLAYLVTAEKDVTTVGELVAQLFEDDDADADRQRLTIRLHHVALPKLAALGFIEYDERSETVRYRESPVLERELRLSADGTVFA